MSDHHRGAWVALSERGKTFHILHPCRAKRLERKVYRVPTDIDREIARLKLASMDVHIDALTTDQEAYLSSWTHGT